MDSEKKKLIALIAGFVLVYFLPFNHILFKKSLFAGLLMLQDYAQKHVLLCLIPAFFIAGSIAVFIKKDAILKLLGAKTSKWVSYPIASISGGILAVCSCTILPLFAGIWKRGAGIGPATAFLYAGPAINIAAIFLTGTILGWELSFVRLGFSILGALLIGLIMGTLFKEETQNMQLAGSSKDKKDGKSLWVFFIAQFIFLVVGTLKIPAMVKFPILALIAIILAVLIKTKISDSNRKEWLSETWFFTKKILPFLFAGVFIAGIIASVLPQEVVNRLVGGNRIFSNIFASVFGAVMYFATLTEVPVIQSLMSLGMGKGPALALFLAGYSLSLPNMIVLVKLMGAKKAFTYIALIVVYSAGAGFVYGNYMFIN